MKKLIVHPGDAPTQSIMSVLATWRRLVDLVEPRVKLPTSCHLEWTLRFQRAGEGQWESYSTIQVIYPATIGTDYHREGVGVPLIDVSEIIINERTFNWHRRVGEVEESPVMVDRLIEALNTGKVETYHYQLNHFPVISG